jgi:hypothetical protein
MKNNCVFRKYDLITVTPKIRALDCGKMCLIESIKNPVRKQDG